MLKFYAPFMLTFILSSAAYGQDMKTSSLAQIESDCSCQLDQESGGDLEEAILFGLSTMWIDVDEVTPMTDAGTLYLSGSVFTEDGEQEMVAAIIGAGDARELRAVLGALGALDRAGARRMILSGKAPATKSQSKPAPKVAPKVKVVTAPKVTPHSKTPFKGINYPGPIIVKKGKHSQEIGNWTQVKNVKFAKTGDPQSPRQTSLSLTKLKSISDSAAVDLVLKEAGLTRAKYPKAESLEVVEKLLGKRSLIAFGAARRDGQIVRFFAFVNINKDGDTGAASVLEAPQDEWNAWGGLGVALAESGVRKPAEFTPQILANLSRLSPADETRLYEEQYTALMMALFKGTMMANMGTLTSMRSFNMSSATCAGDSNCTVTPDGVGGYTAETK